MIIYIYMLHYIATCLHVRLGACRRQGDANGKGRGATANEHLMIWQDFLVHKCGNEAMRCDTSRHACMLVLSYAGGITARTYVLWYIETCLYVGLDGCTRQGEAQQQVLIPIGHLPERRKNGFQHVACTVHEERVASLMQVCLPWGSTAKGGSHSP